MSWLDAYVTTDISVLEAGKVEGPIPAVTSVVDVPSLWSAASNGGRNATLILVIRRLGCPLCRAPCIEIMSLRGEFEKLGVKIIAIAPSHVGAQDFVDEVLSGRDDMLFADRSACFKRAMGAHEYKDWWALNPYVMSQAVSNLWYGSGAKFDDLFDGVPKLRGGELIIDSTLGKVIFECLESEKFEHAKTSTLLEFCRARYAPEAEPTRPEVIAMAKLIAEDAVMGEDGEGLISKSCGIDAKECVLPGR